MRSQGTIMAPCETLPCGFTVEAIGHLQRGDAFGERQVGGRGRRVEQVAPHNEMSWQATAEQRLKNTGEE